SSCDDFSSLCKNAHVIRGSEHLPTVPSIVKPLKAVPILGWYVELLRKNISGLVSNIHELLKVRRRGPRIACPQHVAIVNETHSGTPLPPSRLDLHQRV